MARFFALLPLLAGCPLPDVKDDSAARAYGSGGCPTLCLDMEDAVFEVLAEAGVTTASREDFEAMCADGTDTLDCEACYAHVQADFLDGTGVTNTCGCGVSVDAVRECAQDPEMSDDEAQGYVQQCVDACAAFGL